MANITPHFYVPLKTLGYSLLTVLSLAASAVAAEFPAPKSLGATQEYGRNLQRTMKLLADSTPEKRNTVRVLFYGQSITEQNWSKIVADDLRARFPHADLVIVNRALGGFVSQALVKTAETDLYPFQPDLLIFHVYGAHDKYEDIIRRTRERTCAEILIQTDHVTNPADLTEETDPAKATIQSGQWGAFFNYNFLPSIAKQYGAELCDQRTIWKNYLTDHKLEPQSLLKDGVHLNAHGEFLMAEIVKAHLRRDPKFDPAPAEAWVKTYVVGKDIKVANGNLVLEFEGNRVDVICKAGTAPPAAVKIDGRKPSDIPELYGFTPALTTPPGKWQVKWPVVAPITSEKPLIIEDWSMEITKPPGSDEKLFTFILTGSKTGPDGEGRTDAKFVSKSGRIVMMPDDWNAHYALTLAGMKPFPEKFTAKWSVVPRFVDEFIAPTMRPKNFDTVVTVAQGLANSRHTLEISGGPGTPITAIRIYRPPLPGKAH